MEANARQPFNQDQPNAYGFQFQDPRLSKLANYVMILGSVAAVVAICQGVYGLTQPAAPGGLSGGSKVAFVILCMGIALLVPACGFFGAKNKDPNLAGCFAGCSCLNCCCGACGLVMLMIEMATLSTVLDECEPGSATSKCPDVDWFNKACQGIPNHESDTASECYDYMQTLVDQLHKSMPVTMAVGIPTILLAFCSCIVGGKFYSALSAPNAQLMAPVQVVTTAAPVQPAPVQQAH